MIYLGVVAVVTCNITQNRGGKGVGGSQLSALSLITMATLGSVDSGNS